MTSANSEAHFALLSYQGPNSTILGLGANPKIICSFYKRVERNNCNGKQEQKVEPSKFTLVLFSVQNITRACAHRSDVQGSYWCCKFPVSSVFFWNILSELLLKVIFPLGLSHHCCFHAYKQECHSHSGTKIIIIRHFPGFLINSTEYHLIFFFPSCKRTGRNNQERKRIACHIILQQSAAPCWKCTSMIQELWKSRLWSPRLEEEWGLI